MEKGVKTHTSEHFLDGPEQGWLLVIPVTNKLSGGASEAGLGGHTPG